MIVSINIKLAGQTSSAFKGNCDEHLADVERRPGAYIPSCEVDGNYK